MSNSEAKTTFQLKNNAVRSYGFAGGMCAAGAGCTTPVEVAKATTFRFEPMFEMSEESMFKSFRGVQTAMATQTPNGKQAVEVHIPGGPPNGLTAAQLTEWADEYRSKLGWKKPTTTAEHGAELERAMGRPEDPMEVGVRNRQDERDQKLVAMVLAAVRAEPKPDATAPVIRRGRNDEHPEK